MASEMLLLATCSSPHCPINEFFVGQKGFLALSVILLLSHIEVLDIMKGTVRHNLGIRERHIQRWI